MAPARHGFAPLGRARLRDMTKNEREEKTAGKTGGFFFVLGR
jgi:hypothetical protein